MTTREIFFLFTYIVFPFCPSFLAKSKIIQKIETNVKTTVYFFQKSSLLPKNTAPEIHIGTKQ